VPEEFKLLRKRPDQDERVQTAWWAVFLALLFLSGLAVAAPPQSSLPPGPKPIDTPSHWKKWIGDYGPDDNIHSIFERGQRLWLHKVKVGEWQLQEVTNDEFEVSSSDHDPVMNVEFSEDGSSLVLNDVQFDRRDYGLDKNQIARMRPMHPVSELRASAMAAFPPNENRTFRKPELVELAKLDAAVHLDIRYATSNDFLGTPVYSQARAFLQRPAAEALLRAQKTLKPHGYGLVVYDAYRPWYVTKIFWDATPPEGKIFVADPAQGSRHNRGCAVDLALYDLATAKPIEMPGTYDEMSPRSFPDYPGGTSLQRWHRDLLRRAMESEGFTVYESEWWHFDYKDWREYPILNVAFEKLDSGYTATPVH
jgi:D-alanyl-D-alanine dipeptidase